MACCQVIRDCCHLHKLPTWMGGSIILSPEVTGQWIRYRSRYSSCRSFRVCLQACRDRQSEMDQCSMKQHRRTMLTLQERPACLHGTLAYNADRVTHWQTLSFAASESLPLHCSMRQAVQHEPSRVW